MPSECQAHAEQPSAVPDGRIVQSRSVLLSQDGGEAGVAILGLVLTWQTLTTKTMKIESPKMRGLRDGGPTNTWQGTDDGITGRSAFEEVERGPASVRRFESCARRFERNRESFFRAT